MDVDVFFVGVAVSDFDAARVWYERLFDRTADVIAHESEVMWRVTERGWPYILHDVVHAGTASSRWLCPISKERRQSSPAVALRSGRSNPRETQVAKRSRSIPTAIQSRSFR